VELLRTAEEQPAGADGMPGFTAEKGTVAVKKENRLVLSRAVRVIPAVPGDTLVFHKMIDKNNIFYFHSDTL
jgi:hypothetical protein